MDPTEQAKLLLQVTLLQRHDKADKANCIQSEAEYSVVSRKGQELSICEHDVLEFTDVNILRNKQTTDKDETDFEVVNDALPV
jgi:hypothetical protein